METGGAMPGTAHDAATARSMGTESSALKTRKAPLWHSTAVTSSRRSGQPGHPLPGKGLDPVLLRPGLRCEGDASDLRASGFGHFIEGAPAVERLHGALRVGDHVREPPG